MASDNSGQDDGGKSSDGHTNLSRRRWLEISGVAGAGIFAGCGGDDSETPAGDTPAATTTAGDGDGDGDMDGDGDGGAVTTDTPTATTTAGDGDGGDGEATATETQTPSNEDLPMVEGQTFTTAMAANPAEVVYQPGRPWPDPWLDGWVGYLPLRSFLHDNGIYGPWSNLGIGDFGDKHHTILEDVSINEPNEITYTFKEGATWANGNQITGRDALPMIIHFENLLFGAFPDLFPRAVNGKEKPDQLGKWNAPLLSITNFEHDGRTARWISEPGWLEKDIYRSKQWMWTYLSGVIHGLSGTFYDTSVEPRKSWAEAAFDWWDRIKNEELTNPENAPGFQEYMQNAMEQGFENIGVNSDDHDAMAEWMRDPENMKSFTNGAFMLKEWNGTQSIILEKNPEYFFADRVNFEEVEIISRPEERANWAALKADEYDLYNRGTIPSSTANSFPDNLEQRLARADAGVTMRLRLHPESPFHDVRVRQAVMQLLNTEQIGNAIHPDLHRGITIPGGHLWRASDTIPGGQEWIDENLHDYSADRSLATDLLEGAGWSRQGGVWVDDEGEEVSLTIPTTSDTPDFEVSVSQQLNNFGIDTSIATMSQETFTDGVQNTEFDMWPSENFGVGWTSGENRLIWTALVREGDWEKIRGIGVFPQDVLDDAEEVAREIYRKNEDEEGRANTLNVARRRGEVFRLRAPPIGDWDSKTDNLQEFPVGTYITEDDKDISRQATKWLENWYLPFLPLTQQFRHMFVDSAHYIWPEKETWRNQGVGIAQYDPGALVGTGRVQADPDNTE